MSSGEEEPKEGEGEEAATQQLKAGTTVMLRSGRTVQLGSKTMALDKTESGFGAWDLSGQLLYFGHLFWLAKETCWLLLISYAAFACGAISLVLVGTAMLIRMDGGTSGKLYSEQWAELLINIIHFCWLFWNCVGMVLNFVFEEPDEIPWYAEDMVLLSDCGGNSTGIFCEEVFDRAVLAVRVGFGMTVLLWIVSFAYMLYLWLKPPKYVMEGYSMQVVFLEGGWISFWVLKDLAWSFDEDGFIYACVAWGIHFVLLVTALVASSSQVVLWDGINHEEMERLGDFATTVDLVVLSYIFWSSSSLVWLLMEVRFEEWLLLRYIAAGVCGFALLLFGAGFGQARRKGMAVQMYDQKEEDTDPVLSQRNEPDAQVCGALSSAA